MLYSKQAVALGDVMGLGWGLKLRDLLYDTLWFSYVLAHHEELATILKAYNDDPQTGAADGTLSRSEQSLLDFVKKGHELSSWLPARSLRTWFGYEKRNHIFFRNPIVMSYALYKLYNFFKQ